MNKNTRHNKEPEVYSTTGFKDTLASPYFYPIAVITIVLGVSSILGFLQNPLKLKAVVSVINQKVSVSSPVRSVVNRDLYSLSQSFSEKKINKQRNENAETLNIFLDYYETKISNQTDETSLQRVSFNYDVTSPQFWTDLDTSKIESASEESNRQDHEASMIGIPLESDYFQLHQDTQPLDDSIYTLNSHTYKI